MACVKETTSCWYDSSLQKWEMATFDPSCSFTQCKLQLSHYNGHWRL